MELIEIALADLERWDPRLVKLIRDGEIDPWDIDLNQLAKLYLREVLKKKSLRIGGNAVLILSVILKLKSEIFEEKEEKSREDIEIEIEEPEIEIIPISRKVERKVTIFELVEALKKAFEVEKRKIRKIKPILSFEVLRISKYVEKVLAMLPQEIILEKVSPILLLALLYLANKNEIEVEQDEWNEAIRVRRLG